MKSNKFDIKQEKTGKSYVFLSILLGFLLIGSIFALLFVCPDFIFKNKTLTDGGKNRIDFLSQVIFGPNSTTLVRVTGIIQIIYMCLFIILFWIMASVGILIFLHALTGNKWHRKYIQEQAKIINSCDTKKFNDRVAIVTPTRNDFSPNTLLQTANQTYKKCDVWICNDSTNSEVIKTIEDFAKQHGFHVLHRSAEHKKLHPSKIGNLMYFVEQYGDNYEYILENDSSSIISSTFVENSLCYFHSPLIDTSKTGAVICFGSFYGAKNLVSYLNTKTSQWNDSFGLPVGTNVKVTGHPILLDGWGSFYKISALKNIDLARVECPSDDMARGLLTTRQGYLNYLNPFDFAGKFGPQNIDGWKVQRLKWNGGDIFCIRKNLVFKKLPNKYSTLFVWIQSFTIVIMIIVSFFMGIIGAVLAAILNVYYFNVTATLLMVALIVLIVLVLIVLMIVQKFPIKIFILSIIYGTMEGGIVYKRVFNMIINCIIRHKWSSSAITVKTAQRSTIKQRIRMSVFDFIILMLALGLCLTLNFTVPNLNKFIIWFNILGFVAGPSLLYLIWIWIGEIKVKTGWSDEYKSYNLWNYDFRFKYVKESEIWQKQHSINVD